MQDTLKAALRESVTSLQNEFRLLERVVKQQGVTFQVPETSYCGLTLMDDHLIRCHRGKEAKVVSLKLEKGVVYAYAIIDGPDEVPGLNNFDIKFSAIIGETNGQDAHSDSAN
jgi:hypothetical protein